MTPTSSSDRPDYTGMRDIELTKMKNHPAAGFTGRNDAQTMTMARRIAFAAVFTALAIALSIMENYFPIGLLIPIPGVKLGLANIVTVFAIIMLKPVDTAAIIVTRCLVVGLFTGPVSLFFSLCGAFLAWATMMLLSAGLGRIFSVIGVSMGGAVAHSAGQIIAAIIVLGDFGILFFYLPFLMLISLVTGALTGVAAIPVIRTVRRIL
ncbi:MAG: Gx transporter family protein [Saccharofermentanales bacterium]